MSTSGSCKCPKFTNEWQHQTKVLPWESAIASPALRNDVRLPVYIPREPRSGRLQQVWTARHRQLLGSRSATLSDRSPIRADDPTPTPTSTQATTTKEIPPFDLTAIPHWPDPPCAEEFERKYGRYTYFIHSITETHCSLKGPDGNYLSEAEALLMMAEWERKKAQAAQNAAATEETVDPALSARSITLSDGTVIDLPDDVKIIEVEVLAEYICVA